MRFFLLAALFSVSHAFADTQIILSKDGSKATILMFALSSPNPDASGLYKLMTAPVQNINGRNAKKFQFVDDQGVTAVNLICVFSQSVASFGSCTLVVEASRGLEFSNNGFSYAVNQSEATRLAQNFLFDSTEAWRSSDGHLALGFGHNRFTIEYH